MCYPVHDKLAPKWAWSGSRDLFLNFGSPKISETANPRDLKFCTRVGQSKCSPLRHNLPLNGRGHGNVVHFTVLVPLRCV